jgi:hypothetical protein
MTLLTSISPQAKSMVYDFATHPKQCISEHCRAFLRWHDQQPKTDELAIALLHVRGLTPDMPPSLRRSVWDALEPLDSLRQEAARRD